MFDVISLELFEGDVSKNELSFEKNQLINVKESLDDEHYIGEYTIPGTNEIRSGKFPKSFVEVLSSSVDEHLESPVVPEMSIRDRIASMLKQQEEELLQKEKDSQKDSQKELSHEGQEADINNEELSGSNLKEENKTDDSETSADANLEEDISSENAKKQSLIERMARLSGAGRQGGKGFNPFGIPVSLPAKNPTYDPIEPVDEENNKDIEDLSTKKQFNIMTGEWMDVDAFKNTLKKQKTNEESSVKSESQKVDEENANSKAGLPDSVISDELEEGASYDGQSNIATSTATVDSDQKVEDEPSHVEPEIHPKTETEIAVKPAVPVTTSALPAKLDSEPKPAQVYKSPEIPRTAISVDQPVTKTIPSVPPVTKTASPPVPTMTAPMTKTAPPPVPTTTAPMTKTAPPPVPTMTAPMNKTAPPPPVPSMTPPMNKTSPPPVPTQNVPLISKATPSATKHVSSAGKETLAPVSKINTAGTSSLSEESPEIPVPKTSIKLSPPPIPSETVPPQVPFDEPQTHTFAPPPPVPSKPPQANIPVKTNLEQEFVNSGKSSLLNVDEVKLNKQSVLMNSLIPDFNIEEQDLKKGDCWYFKESHNDFELESSLKKKYYNACLINFVSHEKWLLEETHIPESVIMTIDGKLPKYFAQKEVHHINLDIIGENLSIVAIRLLLEDYSYLDAKVIYNKDKSELKYVEQIFTQTYPKEKDFLVKLSDVTSNLEKVAMKCVGNKTQFSDSVSWVDSLLEKNNFVQVLAKRTFGINILKFDPTKGKLNVDTRIQLGDILVIKDGDYVDGELESLVICNVDEENYSFKCITVDSNGEVIIVGRNFDNMTKGKIRVFRPLPRSLI